MHKLPVGILGASGYAGRELASLVARHPRLELAFAAAGSRAGERVRVGGREVTLVAAEEAPLGDAALVFSALPHGASAEWVGRARAAGAKVVDLSADLRPGNGGAIAAPYGLTELTRAEVAGADVVANPGCYPTAILLALLPLLERGLVAPGATVGISAAPLGDAALVFSALPHGASAEWVGRARQAGAKVVDLSADLRPGNGGSIAAPYGLTELTRAEVAAADVVANPGCYPTAILLALLPLLERGLVAPGATVGISAASGVTGAGFNPRADLMFAEVAEDFRAYGVGNGHRHLNELRAVVSGFGSDADLVFTPHLLPVARGILATITVPLAESVASPLQLWQARYAGEPFVEIVDQPPALKDVVRRNVAQITAVAASGTRRPTLVVLAAIDNLVKGAAGQAVQNANLQLGLDEPTGLS